jgi:D-sedoheptulose 7-phosphate isomerase
VAADLTVAPKMSDAGEREIARHFQRSRDAFERAVADRAFLSAVGEIAAAITDAYRNGGKLLIAGNGGSAADAQHIAAEFLSRYLLDRQPLPAIALTTDTSVLTAVGNDYGFEQAFERQVRGLGRPGDVFLAISTSGRSANVLAALKAAREMGLLTVGFTGSRANDMREHCDHILSVPCEETAVTQQIHIIAAHAICGVVERELFGSAGA